MNFWGSKKMVVLFVIIGIVAVVAMLTVSLAKKKSNTPSAGDKNSTQDSLTKSNVDSSKLPSDFFPADIPIEKDAKILYNYTADKGNNLQATRVFETEKSLADNFRLYQNYFKDTDWTIESTIDQKNLKSMLATRGGLKAQVDISLNPATDIKTVDITINKIK